MYHFYVESKKVKSVKNSKMITGDGWGTSMMVLRAQACYEEEKRHRDWMNNIMNIEKDVVR